MSPPIRIGFVMHVMQVAGAEVLVERMIEELSDQIEPTIFCLDAIGTIGERLRDAGVPVVVLGRRPGLDWSLASRFATEISQRRIEILHAHQYTPFFYSALARLRGAKAKILFTEHGRHYPDVISAKRRWANRLLLSRFADRSTACCAFSAAAIRDIEGFGSCDVLPNGVPLDDLPPRGDAAEQIALRQRLGLSPDSRYVACIARFHPVKDHPTLLRGWAELIQQLPDKALATGQSQPDVKLLLVGDGPERPQLESLCRELGIVDSVNFLGIRRDVADILRAVDVFTLTSVSEAASLTLLEAMASECPPVVTDVGGNGEHLTDGIEGRLVPRGDATALATALADLIVNPEVAQQYGQAARGRVLRQFDLKSAVAAYALIYRQLADRPTP